MKGNFKDFREALKKQESGGRYNIVNRFGYLGAYQFGKQRLYDLGYSVDGWKPKNRSRKTYISKYDFLNNIGLQDRLFKEHCKQLLKIYNQRYKLRYDQKIIHGVKITTSGFIAGCHLVGLGGLLKFLSTGRNVKDGNNVSVKTYIDKFGDYDLSSLEEEQ